jgi:septum formation protein
MIVLASQSEARARLLNQAGISFVAQIPLVDEELFKTKHPSADGQALALELAVAKSLSLHTSFPDAWIIGADQTLTCQGVSFNKPANHASAHQQLTQLRGRTHTLHSAIAVSHQGKIQFQHCENADLTMREFSDSYLQDYLDKAGDAVLHCVGSYQIEGRGLTLFSHISGDIFTIQGLPLLPLLAFLREVGELPT